MRLLFVENHSRFARLTVAQFLASHDVTVVSNLTSSREALAQQTFDAVLLDYDLDDGKGDELMRELQKQTERPLVVAVSSHEVGNDALVAAGADAVCGKFEFAQIGVVLSLLTAQQCHGNLCDS